MNANPYANGQPVAAWITPEQYAYEKSNKGRIERALRGEFTGPLSKETNLRKIRDGLGLSAQYVAALAGISDMTLLHCEDRQDDRDMVNDILAVYALYMATRWGADLLHLTEHNLDEEKH